MRNLKRNLKEHVSTAGESSFAGARETMTKWMEAVSTGRIEDILNLYAPDAILVPTLSNEIVVTEAGRRRYFEFLLSDGGPACTVDHEETRIDRGFSTVRIGGTYTFCFRRPSGEETVPARFLFTFEKLDGHWRITGHHSSRLL